MKTKSFSKIALLLVLCLTALCAIGITASANETKPVAKIDSANVAYNDMVQLAFTVEATDELIAQGAELGIIAWRADVTEFNVATAYYATFTSNEKDGKTYFKTPGIPAPEMDTPIYVAACYRNGNGAIEIAETPFLYSALQYAGSRLTDVNVTANQAKLYEKLIAYGMSSDKVLEGNANYAFVKAINGNIGSAGATIGGWYGKAVLLRAEAKNADHEYFIKWVNADGETISTERLAYVTVDKAGIAEYTALYGAKADSAYGLTYNFENLNDELVDLGTPDLSKAPTSEAYNTTYYNKSWKRSLSLMSLSVSSYMAPVTEKIDGVNTLVKDENGLYSIAAKDVYTIYESVNGDKELAIDRDLCPVGYSNVFNNGSTAVCKEAEFELTYDEIVRNGIFNSFNVTLKDANGKDIGVRVNLDISNLKTVKFSDQKKNNEENNKGRTPFPVRSEIAVGSTLTVKVAINTTDSTITLYANGVNLGTLELSGWGTFQTNTTFVMSDSVTISALSVNCESGTGHTVRIDNVTFFAN